jgi:FixJ family two-component response regulator
VCEALESLLKSIGFRAASFTSARSFLDSPQFPSVSCVILDVSMPEMTGLDLQRHLLTSHPIPIIFITARGGKAREQALRAGAIAFLAKPFSDEALTDALRTALGE